jgi:hypothetical protein
MPKEFGLGLNFFPHGGLVNGTVYHPKARVLLYLEYLVTFRNLSTIYSEKTLKAPGNFPLLSINCMYVITSDTVEKRPAFPAVSLKKWAILLYGVPHAILSVNPEGAILYF